MDSEQISERQTNELEQKHKLTSPYSKVMCAEAVAKYPDKKDIFYRAFGIIDRQVLENFTTFESDGVALPYTKLSITPEMVSEVVGAKNQTEQASNTSGENRSTFCFTAFQEVNNPLAVEDMGIDEFFRNINRVAGAMSRGEPIPNINIYILDLPTAYGGKITPDFLEKIKHNGISEYGKLFSELINSTLPQDPTKRSEYVDNLRIRLHGVSMDSLADQTFLQLPTELQRVTQRLLDNPAGNHNPINIFKGIQAGVGVIGEGLARNVLDPTAKALNEARKPFVQYLDETKGIKKDDKEQVNLKMKTFIATGIKLFRGIPLHLGDPNGPSADMDPTNRGSFIRKGFRDPLTTGPLYILRALMRKDKPPAIDKEGKTMRFMVDKSHVFFYENYDRWAKNLDYCLTSLTK